MVVVRRKSVMLALAFGGAALLGFWSVAPDAFGLGKANIQRCGAKQKGKITDFRDRGVFVSAGIEATNHIVAAVGSTYVNEEGLATTRLHLTAIGGEAETDGFGRTRFWLDGTRPVVSELWEQVKGTGFPAVQEMRFHFFYTIEAEPGRVFRSVQPAVMRSDNVLAFPPPPGTKYYLTEPVPFEDEKQPGEVVGSILSNEVEI